MAKIIHCECGYIARGDDSDAVVSELEAHMHENHPEMVGKYERDELLDMIEET